MKGRRLARRLVIEALYQADIRQETPSESWARRLADLDLPNLGDDDDAAVDDAVAYASHLIQVVEDRQGVIDELITVHAEGWSLERMPVIDRCIARMATAELLEGEVPIAVVANESVELAKELSTVDSPRYLNGLIGRLDDVVRAMSTDN